MSMESEERDTFAVGRLLSVSTRSFSDSYSKERFLGRGAFAEVWVCKEKGSGKEFACKIFEKKKFALEAEKADIQREVALLAAFKGKHQAIVQLHELLETEEAVFAVMELCRGGDLFDLLKHNGKLPEPAVRLVFQQLASALAFCHARGVIHRDIKPENILFEAKADRLYLMEPRINFQAHVQAKLSDFGLAVVLRPGATTGGYTGSRYYTAPEMIRGKEYGRRTDIWSLGVVLCAMLTGRLPFAGKGKDDDEGLMRAILCGKVDFHRPSWNGVSEAARDLVSKMLQPEPQHRLKSCEVLSHPWLVSPSPWATDLATLQLDVLMSSARLMGLMPEDHPPKPRAHLASVSADHSGRSGPLPGAASKQQPAGKRRFQRSETVILEGKKLDEERARVGGGREHRPQVPRSETANLWSRGQADRSESREGGRGFWRAGARDQNRRLVARSGTFDVSSRPEEAEAATPQAQGDAARPSLRSGKERGNGGAHLKGEEDLSGSLKKALPGLSGSGRSLDHAPSAQSNPQEAERSNPQEAPSLGPGRTGAPALEDLSPGNNTIERWQQEGLQSPRGAPSSTQFSAQSSAHSSTQYSAYSSSQTSSRSGTQRSIGASSQSSGQNSSQSSKSVFQKIGSHGSKLWGVIQRKIHPHGRPDGGGASPRIPLSSTIEALSPPLEGHHQPIPKVVTRDVTLAVEQSALYVQSAGQLE